MEHLNNKMKEIFIKTALLLSQKSKCVSKKVGAVIVKDNRIIKKIKIRFIVSLQCCFLTIFIAKSVDNYVDMWINDNFVLGCVGVIFIYL